MVDSCTCTEWISRIAAVGDSVVRVGAMTHVPAPELQYVFFGDIKSVELRLTLRFWGTTILGVCTADV